MNKSSNGILAKKNHDCELCQKYTDENGQLKFNEKTVRAMKEALAKIKLRKIADS